jgi:hypothetical protein
LTKTIYTRTGAYTNEKIVIECDGTGVEKYRIVLSMELLKVIL